MVFIHLNSVADRSKGATAADGQSQETRAKTITRPRAGIGDDETECNDDREWGNGNKAGTANESQ